MLMIMTTIGSCSNTWTARFPQVATNPPLNDTRALISLPALTCTDTLQFFLALIQAPFYESLSNSLMSSISAGTAFIWSYVIKSYMVDGDILSKPVWGLIIYDHTGFDHISPSTIYIYDQTLYMIKPCTSFSSSPSPSSCLQINFEKKKNDGGGFKIVVMDNWICPLW